MKLHNFSEVIQEVGEAVVAGIRMVFMFYLFLLQLFV